MANTPLLIPLNDVEKKTIVDRLKEKGVQGQCPMCSNKNFVLMDGYFNHTMQGNPTSGLVIGGPTIPTVAIVCSNCGFMSHHALGALGLMSFKEGDTK